MSKLPVQQIRGVKDLIQDAVDAGVDATEQVHQSIARKPFALLAKITPIAGPVLVIEQVQHGITTGIYQAIRTVNKLSGALATQVIDRLDRGTDKTTKR